MNIKEQHPKDKPVSTKSIFSGEQSSVLALRILKGARLKEHISKVLALLLCVMGKVIFENENGLKETLCTRDYTLVDPQVLHWVDGIEDSDLVLIK
jgi:quercetin dioxygenase-like cupin family protein